MIRNNKLLTTIKVFGDLTIPAIKAVINSASLTKAYKTIAQVRTQLKGSDSSASRVKNKEKNPAIPNQRI